ncbi:hypothetical protein ACLOJK_004727 [Asimina triloba]
MCPGRIALHVYRLQYTSGALGMVLHHLTKAGSHGSRRAIQNDGNKASNPITHLAGDTPNERWRQPSVSLVFFSEQWRAAAMCSPSSPQQIRPPPFKI